ncbi:MAG: 2-polyprenyl-3-methyl-6-methoxy-1,4-benzoquinone monooxygenase [Thiotrichales bacterium]
MRQYTFFDNVLMQLEKGVHAIHVSQPGTDRKAPAANTAESELNDVERRHAAGLMRVNHSGEIAAQALYNGQALFARRQDVRERLENSAREEADHLDWCKERLEQLGAGTSLLGPMWYWGSFAIGALASATGDRWSLGFIKETEDQVIEHLKGHLQSLPERDLKSKAIIEQMIEDEAKHGDAAVEAGAASLPLPIRLLMRATAKIMTTASYRV